ncbi:MAG: hypothetical protein M3Y83_18880, partial [Actinomycetota bacterium]|nr:hypothetical protein [Actinomycetota bacterium]
PATTALFGVAALGASGLPLGAGFVSEWLLLQSLIRAPGDDAVVALMGPLAMGAVALTVGVGVATMVKAFGIGFLARPRSEPASAATESPRAMVLGMTIAAVGCALIAVVPGLIAPALRRVLETLPAAQDVEFTDFGILIRLPGVPGSIAPAVIAAALAVAILAVVLASQWRARRRPETERLPLWACGAADLTSRMQYTATSFAEPLQRVFDDVLRPDTAIEVTPTAESRYMADRVTYRNRIGDAVEERLYTPIVRAVAAAAGVVRRAHTGSIHLYLAYGGLGVLIIMVVAK